MQDLSVSSQPTGRLISPRHINAIHKKYSPHQCLTPSLSRPQILHRKAISNPTIENIQTKQIKTKMKEFASNLIGKFYVMETILKKFL